MQKHILGSSGLEVSAIGFACLELNFGYDHTLRDEDGVKRIRQAVDRDVTLFDTPEVYEPYTDEGIVGEALRPIRDKW